jgi:NAD(P)-dependent dehydrogenase (short-subunit alcohol dehydrogenase family)
MKVIRGRKALVTAADSPAGRSIALALASEGADVYLFGRNPQELAVTCRAAGVSGVEVISATCDLSEPAQLGAAVESVLERWGRLHILVNNTEEMHCGPTHAMTFEQWDRVLCANLIAPIALVRALLPTLARQDEAHIVNVCSLLGLIPARDVAAVQTGQFGLVGFTAALRAEYCRKGFGMTALCAGLARSSFPRKTPTISGTAPRNGCTSIPIRSAPTPSSQSKRTKRFNSYPGWAGSNGGRHGCHPAWRSGSFHPLTLAEEGIPKTCFPAPASPARNRAAAHLAGTSGPTEALREQ